MKYILIALMSLTLVGCSTNELKVNAADCAVHLETAKTTVDYTKGTLEYNGETKEFQILSIEMPSLPGRP